jgi:hypothetical protein
MSSLQDSCTILIPVRVVPAGSQIYSRFDSASTILINTHNFSDSVRVVPAVSHIQRFDSADFVQFNTADGSIPYPAFSRILLYIFSFVTTQFSNCGAQVELTEKKGKVKDTENIKKKNNKFHNIFFLNWIRKKFFRNWSGTRSLAVEKERAQYCKHFSTECNDRPRPIIYSKILGFSTFNIFLPILIFSDYDPNEVERNAGPRTSICSVIFS